jgi:hypothetical protein
VQEFENAVVGEICALEKLNVYNFSSYYKSPRYFISQHRMGHFFEFDLLPVNEEKASDTKRVWGWIGAYYRNGGAVVCVEFEDRDGWGKSVCDKFREKVKDGCLRFYLEEHKEEEWGDCIKSFLNDVVAYVAGDNNANIFKANISNNEQICRDEKAVGLLGMKILPCLLEQKFFAIHREYDVNIDNNIIKFTLEMSSGSDAEVPNSHCGRYFELKPIADNEKNPEFKSVRGWIGAMYNKDKDKSGEPKLIVEIEKGFANTVLGVLGDKDKKDVRGWGDDTWGWKCKNVEIKDGNVVEGIEGTIQSLFLK